MTDGSAPPEPVRNGDPRSPPRRGSPHPSAVSPSLTWRRGGVSLWRRGGVSLWRRGGTSFSLDIFRLDVSICALVQFLNERPLTI